MKAAKKSVTVTESQKPHFKSCMQHFAAGTAVIFLL